MNSYRVLKAIAWFLVFIAVAAMIPDLTVEWFNFRQFSLQTKMLFVFAAGLMSVAKLILVLREVVE